MDVASLKLEIIQKIISTENIEVLKAIYSILSGAEKSLEINEPSTSYVKEEKFYVLNEWQEERINRALKQFENGECISDEEAQMEIQAWLED